MKSIRRRLLNLIFVATIPLVLGNIVLVASLGREIWRLSVRDIESVTDLVHEFVETTLRESIVSYLRAKTETAVSVVTASAGADPGAPREPELSVLRERLAALRVAESGYIYVIDGDGRVIIHPDPTIVGSVIPNTEPVKTQLTQREGYLEYIWQNSFEPAAAPKALYMLEYEPYDWIIAATAYRGEFVQLVDGERIAETVGSLTLNFEGYSTLVARDGTFIAHPDYVGRDFAEFLDRDETRRMEEALFGDGSSPIRYNWPSRAGERRRPKLMFSRYLPDFDCAVATTVYIDSLQRPTVMRLVATGLFSLLLLAILTIVTLRMSRSISSPIVELAAAAEGAKRYGSPTVNVETPREVALLVEEFNDFVDRIEEQRCEVADREESLRRIVNEKTVLVREIHHRVKNNLQVIASLLSLQADAVRDPRDSALFERSRERVISMAMVHEQLLHADNLSMIPFKPYLESLAAHIHHANAAENIALSVECEEITLEIDRAVPCGVIVTELATNSIEHAFPEGMPGVITVEFRRDGDSYSLRVRDNGVGMSSEATRSLGLTLVETLAEQLGGTLECFLEHGTCVTIRFEASEQGGPQPPRLPA